jgi:hypothetical protein
MYADMCELDMNENDDLTLYNKYYDCYTSTMDEFIEEMCETYFSELESNFQKIVKNSIDPEEVYKILADRLPEIKQDYDTKDESDSDSDSEEEKELVFSSEEE